MIIAFLIFSLILGFTFYGILFMAGKDEVEPVIVINKWKKPWRILMKISFVLFWFIYLSAFVIVTVFTGLVEAVKSIFE